MIRGRERVRDFSRFLDMKELMLWSEMRRSKSSIDHGGVRGKKNEGKEERERGV